jgi:hypothetical protein
MYHRIFPKKKTTLKYLLGLTIFFGKEDKKKLKRKTNHEERKLQLRRS